MVDMEWNLDTALRVSAPEIRQFLTQGESLGGPGAVARMNVSR